MAEDKKILFELKVKTDAAKSAMKETEVQIQKLIQSFKTLEQGSKKYEAAQAKLAVLQNKFAISANNYASALTAQKQVNSGLSDSLTGVSAATGSASASVLEMGRVISDSNYGIRGVANNLSQLASNMVYTAKAAGGMAAGLKSIVSAMLGPLGILLAIQFVIAMWEKYDMNQSEVKKGINGVTDSIEEQIHMFSMLYDQMFAFNDFNPFAKTQQEWAKNIKVMNGQTLTFVEALQVLINEFSEFERKYNSLTDEQKKDSDVVKDLASKYTELLSVRKAIMVVNEKLKKEGASPEINKEIQLLLLRKAQLEAEFKVDKKGGKRREKTLKIYKEQLLDLEKFIQEQAEKEQLSLIRTEEEALAIKQEYARKDLKLQHDTWVEKERLRLKNFLASNATPEAKAEAEKVSNAAVEEATVEHNKALTQLNNTHSSETSRFNEKQRDKEISDEFKFREKQIKNQIALYDEQKILRDEEQIRLEEERIARAELEAERLPQESSERYLAELAISEMRMDLQSRELDHELMIIDAKKNAQMEYVNYMSQIGGIMSSIAGENKALAIASLLVQKGAAIAGIVVAANASIASQTLANTQALGLETAQAAAIGLAAGPLAGPALAGAYLGAKKGLLVAQLATGIAKTKTSAAISIGSILASTLSSVGGISGGGSGGSTGSVASGRTFDFNLVGSTGVNQLAQTVGGQVSQPIKAYVVGSEITNQQAFDNQIQGQATIG